MYYKFSIVKRKDIYIYNFSAAHYITLISRNNIITLPIEAPSTLKYTVTWFTIVQHVMTTSTCTSDPGTIRQ